MDSETTENQSLWFYDLVAWLDAHRKQLILGIIIVCLAAAAFSISLWKKGEDELSANTELFALPSYFGSGQGNKATAEAYLKVAKANDNTTAGARALLLGAGLLFSEGKYAEAQAQFSKFLSEHGNSELASQGAFGVAASLDAQNKADQAITAYQDVVSKYPTSPAVAPARLALARIYEVQNKPDQALKIYDDLARVYNPYDTWSNEAGDRREQLLIKFPALVRTNSPLVSSNVPTLMPSK